MTPATPDTPSAAVSSDSATTAPYPRPSKRLVASLMVLVVAIAIAGYAFTGSPSLARLGASSNATVAKSDAPGVSAGDAAGDATTGRELGLQQIAERVDKLAERMKSRPDDAEGWTMLARSYAVLGRYAEAVPAYRRATQLEPKNAGLLADYADALGAASEGHVTPEFSALLERALAIDPLQPKALALAGTVAFERGDFAQAAAQWQRIADSLPPASEFRQQVQANIDEARRRESLTANISPSKGAASSVTSSRAAGVSGTVTLAPALVTRVAPTDTVFVFARSAEGGRMPLAVVRATVADLPLHFKLDDSMAMTTMKLSDAKQVIVGARISKSGNAIPQAGDLSGESGPIAPEKDDVAIAIDAVVTGK